MFACPSCGGHFGPADVCEECAVCTMCCAPGCACDECLAVRADY